MTDPIVRGVHAANRLRAKNIPVTPASVERELAAMDLEQQDPYRAATDAAPRTPVPTDDPNYQLRGTPPDGYMLALQERRRQETQ
jgi:hypothetical protein